MSEPQETRECPYRKEEIEAEAIKCKRKQWKWQGVMAAAVAAVAVVTGSATAGPPSTSAVAVEVQSESVTGLRPNGTTVIFQIKVVAGGADASTLSGEGRHFGSNGAHNYWPATGSIEGNVVTLAGVVTESNAAFHRVAR